jgi:hypothetical protein
MYITPTGLCRLPPPANAEIFKYDLWVALILSSVLSLRSLRMIVYSISKIEGFHSGDYEQVVFWDIKTHFVPHRIMLCIIWGFRGGDYEECRLLGYKHLVRTSQETHCVSAREPSQLFLCKIWGFHCGDYEEYRLLGYKSKVHTSQKTHYVSSTEPSVLIAM